MKTYKIKIIKLKLKTQHKMRGEKKINFLDFSSIKTIIKKLQFFFIITEFF